MEEKKVSKTGNKYYEVILDWFRQQILSGQMKEGDTIHQNGSWLLSLV